MFSCDIFSPTNNEAGMSNGHSIYSNGTLERILTEKGYIQGGEYYFYIKDYQGNIRVVLNQSNQPVELNSYYPYGALMAATATEGTQPYKYSAKELDRENGIDLYDFHARQMEPLVGRFTSIDKKSEKFYSISPYTYCAANPIRFVDPTGKETHDLLKINAANMAAKEYAKTKSKTKNIEVFAHGNGTYMEKRVGVKKVIITAENFEEQVLSNSRIWQNSKSKSGIMIILHSCHMGKEGGLAEKLSKKYPNVVVKAALKNVQIIKTSIQGQKPKFSEKGNYVYYKNGKQYKRLPKR